MKVFYCVSATLAVVALSFVSIILFLAVISRVALKLFTQLVIVSFINLSAYSIDLLNFE
jgi:hypothetical protein